MEISIPRVNPLDAVLPHQYGGHGIVHQVAAQVGDFFDDAGGHLGVPLGGDEDLKKCLQRENSKGRSPFRPRAQGGHRPPDRRYPSVWWAVPPFPR